MTEIVTKLMTSRDEITNTKTDFRHGTSDKRHVTELRRPVTKFDRDSLVLYLKIAQLRIEGGQGVRAVELLEKVIYALNNR